MAAPRTIASNAAPAGRRDQNETAGTTRPELHVVKGTRAEGNGVKRGVEQLITGLEPEAPHCCIWSLPSFFLEFACGILDATHPNGAAFLERNQIESNFTRLTQDVEDDQTKLDELEASLPSKAEEWVMVPQKGP